MTTNEIAKIEADTFNRDNPIGTHVKLTRPGGSGLRTTTRSVAFVRELRKTRIEDNKKVHYFEPAAVIRLAGIGGDFPLELITITNEQAYVTTQRSIRRMRTRPLE